MLIENVWLRPYALPLKQALARRLGDTGDAPWHVDWNRRRSKNRLGRLRAFAKLRRGWHTREPSPRLRKQRAACAACRWRRLSRVWAQSNAPKRAGRSRRRCWTFFGASAARPCGKASTLTRQTPWRSTPPSGRSIKIAPKGRRRRWRKVLSSPRSRSASPASRKNCAGSAKCRHAWKDVCGCASTPIAPGATPMRGDFFAGVAHLPIDGVEEPLANPSLEKLRVLQETVPFALAVDESLFELVAEKLFAMQAVRRLVLKPARIGGLRRDAASRRKGGGGEDGSRRHFGGRFGDWRGRRRAACRFAGRIAGAWTGDRRLAGRRCGGAAADRKGNAKAAGWRPELGRRPQGPVRAALSGRACRWPARAGRRPGSPRAAEKRRRYGRGTSRETGAASARIASVEMGAAVSDDETIADLFGNRPFQAKLDRLEITGLPKSARQRPVS